MSGTSLNTPLPPSVGGQDTLGFWVGGEPTDRYRTGTKLVMPLTIFGYRIPTQEGKSYHKRIEGTKIKLSKNDKDGLPIQAFADMVWLHFINHGLDSVFYIPDKSTTTGLVNLFTSYNKYKIEEVATSINDMKAQGIYDDFDKKNLLDSAMFLRNSVDSSIHQIIYPYLKPETTGPEVWMRIIGEVQSSSSDRLLIVVEKIKRMKVSDYKGMDVKQFCSQMMTHCTDLQFGGSLPREICVTIVEAFLNTPVERFRMEFYGIRPLVMEQFNEYNGLSQDDIIAMQAQNRYYTYQKLLDKGSSAYQALIDQRLWSPNVGVRDRMGAPESMSAEVNALVQKGVARFKKSYTQNNGNNSRNNSTKVIKCYYCNELGHYKNECPKLKNKGNKFASKTTWKYRAPNSGEPQSKTVDGIEYHWCAKCGGGRWTTTHGTNEHKEGGSGAGSGRKGVINNNTNNKGFGWDKKKPETNLHAFSSWGDWNADDSSDDGNENYDTTCTHNLRSRETWSAEVDLGHTAVVDWLTSIPGLHWLLGMFWGAVVYFGINTIQNWYKKHYSEPKQMVPTPKIVEFMRQLDDLGISLPPQADISDAYIPFPGINRKLLREAEKNKSKLKKKRINPTPLESVRGTPCCWDHRQTWYHHKPNNCSPSHGVSRKTTVEVRKNRNRINNNPDNTNHRSTYLCKRLEKSTEPVIYKKDDDDLQRKKHEINVDGKVFLYDDNTKSYRYMYTTLRQPQSISTNLLPDWNVFSSDRTRPIEDVSTAPFVQQREHGNDDVGHVAEAFQSEAIIQQSDPHLFESLFMNNDTKEILWDTGATASVVFDQNDVDHGSFIPSQGTSVMKGLATGLQIMGTGTVTFSVRDTKGKIHKLSSDVFYVPSATRRIFSPQAYFQHTSTPTNLYSTQNRLGIDLHFEENQKDSTIHVNYNKRNNLPTFYACQIGEVKCGISQSTTQKDSRGDGSSGPTMHEASVTSDTFDSASRIVSVVGQQNTNLSESQKELLIWHHRFGHCNLRAVQQVLKSGSVGMSAGIRRASKCELPKCASCLFSKAKRRHAPTTGIPTKNTGPGMDNTNSYPISTHNPISRNHLFPGSMVSMDHFSVRQPGRLYETRGTTKADRQYSGGCIFVDHATGYVHVCLHIHQNSTETIEAKQDFEKHLFEHGIIVNSYHSDNGIFTSRDFVKEIESNHQAIRYSGVGGHHQNGIAERAIGTILSMARTMLIHSSIHWPEGTNINLWPMAVNYAVWVHNHIPKTNGISPLELISSSKGPRNKLLNCQVFGSPTYVLDPRLHSAGGFIPKFSPRSRRGVFVGVSPRHSSTVPLILNLTTLTITPQYHVVFDNTFTTVHSGTEITDVDPSWLELFNSSRYQYTFEEDEDIMNEPWVDERSLLLSNQQEVSSMIQSKQQHIIDITQLPEEFKQTKPSSTSTLPTNDATTLPINLTSTSNLPISTTTTDATTSPSLITQTPTISLSTTVQPHVSVIDNPQVQSSASLTSQHSNNFDSIDPHPTPISSFSNESPRRSNRSRKPPDRYGYSGTQGYGYVSATNKIDNKIEDDDKGTNNELMDIYMNLIKNKQVNSDVPYLFSCYTDYPTNTVNYPDPAVFSAIQNHINSNKDILRYHEAVVQPDWEHFRLAAEEEIRTLESMNTWIEVAASTVPSNKRVLDGTWVFARKRNQEGLIRKYKGRFCVRGDQQLHGIDYFESYAPVTSWSTIRLLFIISIIAGLATVQVDYTNAFAQAKINEEVYIKIPIGFTTSNNKYPTVLRLLKSLYGLVQAPRTFYEYLTDVLKSKGFTSDSNIDACLWINKELGIICVIYVDDCLFFAKKEKIIHSFLDSIKQQMPLKVEDTVTAFLGIKIEQMGKQINLTQPSLINQIIKATDLVDCNPTYTPTEGIPLGSDKYGKPFQGSYDYASVVGMLMFLANNTRPDIAFATHQVARFTHGPKESHGNAIKRIIRYLQGTKDKGMILEPNRNFTVDCYVDADFAGLYPVEDKQDPISARSRTGYVMFLANCPLLWVSKLQNEAALSTMESEYVALSQSLRDLIPLRRLVTFICNTIFGKHEYQSCLYSKVFEDNQGALQLARAPRMTPRTKHYGIKYHFFRDYVAKGDIKLIKIESREQRADIFTKGLARPSFEYLRKYLLGW